MRNKKFTEVFEDSKIMVAKIVARRMGNRPEVEEIVQQVFMAYYENMDTIDDDLIKPWLIFVARTKCVDFIRKERKDMRLLERLQSYATNKYNPEEEIIRKITENELFQEIMSDLKKTNKGWYEAIYEVGVRENSVQDAAKHLGLTSQMLRAKLYRARKYIRQKYGQEFQSI